jgi:hypothetical protein
LKEKLSGSVLENRDYGPRGSAALITRHPSIRNFGTNFVDKRQSLARYCLFHFVCAGIILEAPVTTALGQFLSYAL